MTKKLSVLFCMCVIGGLLMGQMLPYANYLPQVSKQKNRVIVRINPQKGNGVYYLYYRAEGSKNFQVRKMQAEDKGVYSYPIVTANLYGRNIEYFVVEKKADGASRLAHPHGRRFHPEGSPEIYFQSDEPRRRPRPRAGPPLNVNASLSTSTKLDESNDSDYYQQNYTANGNLRIFRNISKNDYQLDFDTNFVHIDPYEKTENRINLSSMMVRFKKGNMQFEAGDVAVNQTEFTTSYLNRRGLRFEMNGKSLYLNSFYTNSQQKTGFDGYGIPDASAGIFGAVAGINLKNTVKVRGMFMTGKDNLDSKTVSYNENPFRPGDMFSLWGELNLLKNRLQLAGEISSSNYGAAAVEDDLKKESDTAWKAGLKYNQGIFSFGADYEDDRQPVQLDRQPVPAERPRGTEHQPRAEHQDVLLEYQLYRQEELPAQPGPGHAPPEAGRHHLQLGHRQPFPHRRRPVARQPGLRLLDRPADLIVRHEHQQLQRLVRLHGRIERRQPSTWARPSRSTSLPI